MKWIVLLSVLIVGGLVIVRFAPSDPARWHVDPNVSRDSNGRGSVRRLSFGHLAALDEIIRATPRTRILTGSVDAGHITYVTRSAFWGFPDYTSVKAADGRLEIYARLRFGRSDFGVNRNRVEGWLEALAQV